MTTSPILGLPYVASQQDQPEVTHNDALNLIQIFLYGVTDGSLSAPPGSPTEGASYIVGAAPTGAWASYPNHLTAYIGGAWVFVPGRDSDGAVITMGADQEGMSVYDKATERWHIWSGSTWTHHDVWLRSNTVAGLPAAGNAGRMRFCTNETGGAVPVFDDGTNWRRVTDRAVAS